MLQQTRHTGLTWASMRCRVQQVTHTPGQPKKTHLCSLLRLLGLFQPGSRLVVRRLLGSGCPDYPRAQGQQEGEEGPPARRSSSRPPACWCAP